MSESINEIVFGILSFVWMCCCKTSDNRINQAVYNDNVSTFAKLLEKNISVAIHEKYLRILAADLYQTIKNLANLITYEVFE